MLSVVNISKYSNKLCSSSQSLHLISTLFLIFSINTLFISIPFLQFGHVRGITFSPRVRVCTRAPIILIIRLFSNLVHKFEVFLLARADVPTCVREQSFLVNCTLILLLLGNLPFLLISDLFNSWARARQRL